MALESINPKNKQLIKKFDELSDKQIKQKVVEAQSAFEAHRQTDFSQRAQLMHGCAKILRDRKQKLAAIITDEVGKTLTASKAEIEKCANVCEFYADNAREFLSEEYIKTDASQSYVRFDPIGIVLAIMPWNFPFWQVFRFAAPALMAGNVGLLKHAANVQLSAYAIEEIFESAGFSKGCFLNLAISSGAVEKVICDERVKAVTLTGSEKAGSAVAATAGRELKKTVLELGGSDPYIVLADADIKAAAEAAVIARLQYNCGQSCIAAKRFIIEEPIADKFIESLKAEVSKLKINDPTEAETDVGPMANEKMLSAIQRQVDDSLSQGAELVAGGNSDDKNGYFYNPAIVVGNDVSMPIFSEETFGPVFAVIKVRDAEQAVKVANDSPFGLGATIFTSDSENAIKNLAPSIESGSVFINGPVKSDPRLPFGGVKNSGYGRELSEYGIKEFVNIKTVWVK
ncbi:NAD-dependent succinate-semialdehyde dehydrogenase [Candidatus Parcubacteria bacterium]|nr:NAD-dependent succinate-semialdehyde dehydrogenase [Candidatus Parcubacteria bacterium]